MCNSLHTHVLYTIKIFTLPPASKKCTQLGYIISTEQKTPLPKAIVSAKTLQVFSFKREILVSNQHHSLRVANTRISSKAR